MIVSTGRAFWTARVAIRSAPGRVYSGVCRLAFHTPNLPAENPDLNQMIGGGMFVAWADGELMRTVPGFQGTT